MKIRPGRGSEATAERPDLALPNLIAFVCVQGSGRPPRDCMPDSSSLSDQEAVLCAADSGIGEQRRHHPTVMMGNPGLLQKLPDIAALLSEAGGDSEQSAAADRTLAGLDAMADFSLNHRLPHGTLGGVVGGLDSLDLQEGPKGIRHLEDLLTGAHRLGPWRSFASLDTQLHHPLQPGHKGLADRPAALLQAGPVNRSIFVTVPVFKQLSLQVKKFRTELGAGARAFSDGGEIADQVRPAQLALLAVQMVGGREAIAHHNPAKAAPQHLDGGSRRPTQALDEHRHHGGDHDPLPAPFSRGIVAHHFAEDCVYGIAGGGDGLIHVSYRLLTGKCQGPLHGHLQRGADPLADHCNRSTADLHPKQLLEQRLGLAKTQREGTAQQAH